MEYENADEALTLFQEIAELRPKESFGIPRPRRENRDVIIEPSSELIDYVGSISQRIDRIQGGMDPRVDNMLKVITDGRKAALDLELVDVDDRAPGKPEAVIRETAAIHHRTKDLQFPGDEETGARGGFQIIFCDLGTPGDRRQEGHPGLREDPRRASRRRRSA